MAFWFSEIALIFLAHFDEWRTAFRFLKDCRRSKEFFSPIGYPGRRYCGDIPSLAAGVAKGS
jgi:hypothetical protein